MVTVYKFPNSFPAVFDDLYQPTMYFYKILVLSNAMY